MSAPYELIYWPGIPGRGEHIRLAFEEAGVPYQDLAVTDAGAAVKQVQALAGAPGDAYNPPIFAPPALRHGTLLINQVPNILLYLAPRLGLVPAAAADDGQQGLHHVTELALTALDGLSNETHDTHHPIASSLYYEDQKVEAQRRAADYRENRLPKFLGYFERVLHSPTSGEGPWLYGGKLTFADLVLFQCLDGNIFAFPKALARLRSSGQYDAVFALYEAVKERPNIKAYLASERRQQYSMGIYRHYPELDDE